MSVNKSIPPSQRYSYVNNMGRNDCLETGGNEIRDADKAFLCFPEDKTDNGRCCVNFMVFLVENCTYCHVTTFSDEGLNLGERFSDINLCYFSILFPTQPIHEACHQ